MKMTTEISSGIATPDELETRLGNLKFFDGAPDKETREVEISFAFQKQSGMSTNQFAVWIEDVSGAYKKLFMQLVSRLAEAGKSGKFHFLIG